MNRNGIDDQNNDNIVDETQDIPEIIRQIFGFSEKSQYFGFFTKKYKYWLFSNKKPNIWL